VVEQDDGPKATFVDAGKAPGQADQKGEEISPLAPLPLTELPADLDFIASKTRDEKAA